MQIVKNKPYHIQTYELLKNMILSGKITCGEKVNEIKISQELHISRSPVREAIRILEADNLVVPTASGHIVNPMTPETVHNVYECRIGLESYAARLAIRNFTREDYDILIRSVDQCRQADGENDLAALIDLNTFFHDHIVSITKNDFIIMQIERIRNIVTLSRLKELQQESYDLSYAYNDHVQIADKLLEGDGDAVEQLMRGHLSNNMISILV